MLQNYLKIALRTLRKHTGYAAINIVGLAVGLACCLLIALYVRDELRYDRFHEQAERMYRIIRQEKDLAASVTPGVPLAPALAATYPEVEHATRLFRYWFTPLVSRGPDGFYEDRFFFADTAFFDVFNFAVLRGDPATALDAPFSVLLTERMARKYFGDADPLGQTLTINAAHPFTVTGVLADPPRTSHVTFDFLASLESAPAVIGWPELMTNWGLGAFPTYVVLQEGYDPADLEAKLVAFADAQYGAEMQMRFRLQPLTDIHLHSAYRGEIEPNSDVRYVYLLTGIALIILLLACINYTNLATARFARRTREVGIRKVVGANRRHLIAQFLGESVLLTGVALGVALALLEGLLPAFNALLEVPLTFSYAEDYGLLALLAGIALAAGLLAGSYPAFFLSAFQPRDVLKGAAGGPRRTPLRTALVVTQYAIAVVLLVGTGVIFQQLDYISASRLGFDQEQVVILPVRDDEVRHRPDLAKAAFLQHPDVIDVSATTSVPGTAFPGTSDLAVPEAPQQASFTTFMGWVDDAYLQTLGMEMAAGRFFSRDLPTDAEALLVNETMVRELGWTAPEDALGQTVQLWGRTHHLIGVVRDFHLDSLHEPIKPLLLFPQFDEAQGLVLRLRTDDLSRTLRGLEATWKELSAAQPFTYSFLDQDLDRLYAADRRWGRLIGTAAGLALLIACLGLFGLASFMAEQRTKEIGVRKVMGASAAGLVLLLSKDFVRLVGLAFVLGVPLAYLGAHRYLDGFAYHVDPSAGLFLLAGVVTLGIALLSVSFQALRAALADPVKSLRYE